MHDIALVEQNRQTQKAALRCALALRFLHSFFVIRVRLDSLEKTKKLMLLFPRFICLLHYFCTCANSQLGPFTAVLYLCTNSQRSQRKFACDRRSSKRRGFHWVGVNRVKKICDEKMQQDSSETTAVKSIYFL